VSDALELRERIFVDGASMSDGQRRAEMGRRTKVAKITVGKPMWRNGRGNGLKIEVFAFSLLVSARQLNRVFPGKLRKFVI